VLFTSVLCLTQVAKETVDMSIASDVIIVFFIELLL
jgi:hypothetical protein